MKFLSGKVPFGQQGFGRYYRNTFWLLLEKGLRVIEAFFIGLWLARFLGPDQFGVLSYSQSFVYLFTAVAALGLDQVVVRELVRTPEKRDTLMGTTLLLRILGFIAMFSFIGLTLWSSDNSTTINTVILIIAVSIFFQSFNGIDFYFQSKVLSKYVVYTNVVVITITGVLKVILILNDASVVSIAYVFVVETLLTALGFMICYSYNKLSMRQWNFNWGMAKQLLQKSWFLMIGSIAAALYMKIDQVMIKEFMDETAVGLYSAAVKLSSIWLFVVVAITQTIFPLLVELRKKSRTVFLEKLQLLYNLIIKIAVVASILYTIFADYFVVLLFGEAYAESSGILTVYIWSIIFVYLSNGSWGYYLNENLEKFASIRLVIGAVINISLNFYFIEWFGLLGAAYATLISYSISGYFINIVFKKTRDNFYLQTRSFVNLFNIKTWLHPL